MPNNVTISLRVKTAALSELEKVKSKLNGLTTSKGFQNAVMGVGISAGMAAWSGLQSAISGVGQYLGDAIQNASDLSEAQNKANVVFGESSRVIDDFAATSSRAWGMSKRAAYEATGTFGNLFSTIGLGKDQAAAMSVKVTQLAADLASFNNLGTEEVLANIRSGLVGEAEPLRKFGILLNEANVKAKAVAMGLARANGVVSEGAKLQARYALILEQSTTAQGDFARTSDGMANTQKSLQAEMENLSAEIGEQLLPIMRDLAVFVRDDLIPILRTLVDLMKLLTLSMPPNEEATLRVAEAQRQLYTSLDDTYSMLQETRPEWARAADSLKDMERGTRETASSMFNFGQMVSGVITSALKPFLSAASDIAKVAADWGPAFNILRDGLKDITDAGNDARKAFDSMRKGWQLWDDSLEEKRRYKDLPLLIKQAAGQVKIAEAELTAARKSGNKQRIIDAELALREAKRNLADLRTELKRTDKQMDLVGTSALGAATNIARLIAKIGLLNNTGGLGEHRQLGGPVLPGQSYTVGEAGPETFVPNTFGTIIPNGGGTGNARPIQNTIVVQVDGRELARVVDERQYWALQTAPATTRAS